MEELAERTDIVITNTDKGGPVVIMNTNNYTNEANRQLSDKDNYKQLPNDPTLQHNEIVNNTVERFQKEISSQKNYRRPKNIESKNTKISHHTKNTQRKQFSKTCYTFHRLPHF